MPIGALELLLCSHQPKSATPLRKSALDPTAD